MSKLWAMFNSLQLINSLPLFKIDMPANVLIVLVEFQNITKLELVKPDVALAWLKSLFGVVDDVEASVVEDGQVTTKADMVAAQMGIDKSDLVTGIYLFLLISVVLVLLIMFIVCLRQ